MKRQALPDGRWFDFEQSTRWAEATRWDGSNHISVATGSQWDHQAIYRTASGKWILNFWSQYQGRGETWQVIDPEAAARWLVRNEHALPPDLAEQTAELEV